MNLDVDLPQAKHSCFACVIYIFFIFFIFFEKIFEYDIKVKIILRVIYIYIYCLRES